MSDDFKKLQELINQRQFELGLKKSLKDPFGVWLYWMSETNKPKFMWKIFVSAYWLFSSEWFWIPISIVLAFKVSFFYLLGIFMSFLLTKIFAPIGRDLILSEAKNNEHLFDDLWHNDQIGIMSKRKRESAVHIKGTPEIIIDPYNQDWRVEVRKI